MEMLYFLSANSSSVTNSKYQNHKLEVVDLDMLRLQLSKIATLPSSLAILNTAPRIQHQDLLYFQSIAKPDSGRQPCLAILAESHFFSQCTSRLIASHVSTHHNARLFLHHVRLVVFSSFSLQGKLVQGLDGELISF